MVTDESLVQTKPTGAESCEILVPDATSCDNSAVARIACSCAAKNAGHESQSRSGVVLQTTCSEGQDSSTCAEWYMSKRYL